MTEIGLQGARVVPRIGQRIAATVSQHVRMDRKWHLGTGANAAEQGMECLGRRGFCFFRRRGALDIRRDCEPGKGSVFTVRLPASSDRNDGLRKPERKNSHLAARSDNLLDSYGDDLRQSATASQRTSSKQLDQNESRQHRGYHVARRPVHSRAVSYYDPSMTDEPRAKGGDSANHFVPITPRHAGHAGCRCGLGSSMHSMSHGAKGAYTSAYRVRIW